MRNLFGPLLAAFLTLPMMAQADLPHGNYDRAETALGVLEVTGARGNRRLAWNGSALDVSDWDVNILGVYAEPGAPHVWAVVASHSGGNGCFATYMILRIGADGIHRTPLVGHCGGIQALRLSGGVFTLEQGSPKLTVDKLVITFDGVNLTETEIAAAAPPAVSSLRGGDDALRWVGTHPSDLVRDPEEQARFLQIMTWPELDALKNHISVANKVVRRGDWVLGAGCFPHACNVQNGFWGIRISTGDAVAVIMSRGQPDRKFGDRFDFADGTIRQFIAERRPK